jgi:anti-sigma regulatory factor (Ser/Thr protein kinase)
VNDSPDRRWSPTPGAKADAEHRVDASWARNEPAIHVPIRQEADVAVARQAVRSLAPRAALSNSATHALTTAVSEIAYNIAIHAGAGELVVRVVDEPRRGLVVIARDAGPGIADVERAMQDGFSTARGLGLGLSSAQRLVDDFELVSARNRGTTVTLKKWAS